MNSPCFECTRVKDPQNCENKTCREWQTWFIDRWDAMRKNIRLQMEEAPMQDLGVPLGGYRYISPHRVREYRNQDPCERCLCPKDQCHAPCPSRLAWAKLQREVKP